jgi:Ohr subfamily peroxiredoxin
MGGPANGVGSNPEQLFAAGYSACFGSALRLVALRQKVNPAGFTTTAHVSLVKEGEAFGIAVEMHATMPGLPKEQAQTLIEAAHQVCPYSKATRGNIPVTLVVDA